MFSWAVVLDAVGDVGGQPDGTGTRSDGVECLLLLARPHGGGTAQGAAAAAAACAAAVASVWHASSLRRRLALRRRGYAGGGEALGRQPAMRASVVHLCPA
eukprot:360751-Chlamydomonas_euryale.AAC.3